LGALARTLSTKSQVLSTKLQSLSTKSQVLSTKPHTLSTNPWIVSTNCQSLLEKERKYTMYFLSTLLIRTEKFV
jgi:hypothetical protein